VIYWAQAVQDSRHKQKGLQGTTLGRSAFSVEHVGIYIGLGEVREIGPTGLERKRVAEREHYDLVVRSEVHGQDIANQAKSARCGQSLYYPLWDILTVSSTPHPGARLLDRERILLQMRDREWKLPERNVLQQAVICSHFVNAVLYAAVRPDGTLATASDHCFDDLFRVSPSQMWREFIERQGIWREVNAIFVGIQHKGKLRPDIEDLQALDVGNLYREIVSI
jgi:hypothetical protein